MIAKAERIEAVVTILSVVSDRFDQKAFSIEALVPEFTTPDRSIPTKFIKWSKSQGNAPDVNEEGLAVLEPVAVQKRHVDSGKYPSSDVSGIEMAYEVNWAMLSFEKLNGSQPRAEVDNTSKAETTPYKAPTALKAGTPIDALTRYKCDQMAINDREAIRLVIEHGKTEGSSLYTGIEDVLRESQKIRDELNDRFLMRLAGDSPLVEKAVEYGATVADVVEQQEELFVGSEPEVTSKSLDIPRITNEKDLRDWITSKEYKKDEILGVLKTLNVSKVTDYLSQNGKTPQGLAQILHERLGDNVPW